jgi:hypothetical protein
MIYIVKRASEYKGESPCEEAIKRPFSYLVKNLLHDGSYVYREDFIMLWSIEINSLEDLHKFIDKYGSLVINNKYKAYIDNKYTDIIALSILIYDDYI